MYVSIHFVILVVNTVFISQSSSLSIGSSSKPPNILFFLTDDQEEFGSLEPMSKARHWIAEQGVTFENAFVTVPLCCASRSSILTGLYQHNTKVFNNSIDGNCYGSQWRNHMEKNTYATALKSNGYTTYYAGQYLPCYCSVENELIYDDLSVPPGWDNWAALCGRSL